jgi:thiol-disulfide isomerase/thioredoxin
MKVLIYLLGIIIFTGTVSLNGGCKEKDHTPQSQTQSAQQKEPGEATGTPRPVAVSAEQTQPLSTGAKVPTVLLKTVDGQTVELVDFIKEKPTVLVFYRGGWCPYCNTQLGQLKEIEQQILDAGW